MKRIAAIMMCMMMIAATGCTDVPASSPYDVPDVVKTDALIDVAAWQAAEVVTEKVFSQDGVDGYLMDVAPYTEGVTTKSFFWVGKPSGKAPKGGYPAVLLVHGGGGNAFVDWVRFWNDAGYVALSLDIGGQMYNESGILVRNPDFRCDGSWGSVACGTDAASFARSWTCMNATACIRANNYLRSLSFVNKDKIVMTGISWGGYMTSIVSGLDKRFRAFAPVYGCGSLDTDSWGLNTAGLIGLGEDARAKWRTVYDPTSYMPYATRPMLFVSGMTDHAFSSVSHKKSTAHIPGKVFYAYTASLEHGHYWNMTPCVGEFFDHILNGAAPLVRFDAASYADGTITLTSATACDACIVYTRSTARDSHEWKWESEDITLTAGSNTVPVDGEVTAVFVAGYGEESTYPDASTDIFFPNGYEDYI